MASYTLAYLYFQPTAVLTGRGRAMGGIRRPGDNWQPSRIRYFGSIVANI
jgi:hypothetical protein